MTKICQITLKILLALFPRSHRAHHRPPPLGSDLYGVWGNNWNLFVQDDIRVSTNLTINAGLRWERPTSFHSVDSSGYAFNHAGQGSLMWANPNFTAPILAAGGNPNYLGCCVSNQLVNIDTKDFAPRIGFAYRPPATDKVVVRGSYGLFYDTYTRFYDGTQIDENNLYTSIAAPYTSTSGLESQSTAVVRNLWAAPQTAIQGFSQPSYTAPLGQVYWPFNHNPYNQQWSLDLEYSIGSQGSPPFTARVLICSMTFSALLYSPSSRSAYSMLFKAWNSSKVWARRSLIQVVATRADASFVRTESCLRPSRLKMCEGI